MWISGEIQEADVEKTLKLYLVGEEPVAGLLAEDGEKIPIHDAFERGLIRRGKFYMQSRKKPEIGKVKMRLKQAENLCAGNLWNLSRLCNLITQKCNIVDGIS